MKAIGRFIRTVLILAIIVIGGAVAYALSGHYEVSVGSGHTAVTNWYLETLRDRSIERRAEEVSVPDLNDEAMIESGAVAYDQSCAGCHGRPGREPSGSFEPRPPALTRGRPDPAETYWVVRNGIKMSAMPRIGEERMSDEAVWATIAFLQTASSLTEGEYRELATPPEPAPEPQAESDGDQPADEQAEGNEAVNDEQALDENSDNGNEEEDEPAEPDDNGSRNPGSRLAGSPFGNA